MDQQLRKLLHFKTILAIFVLRYYSVLCDLLLDVHGRKNSQDGARIFHFFDSSSSNQNVHEAVLGRRRRQEGHLSVS